MTRGVGLLVGAYKDKDVIRLLRLCQPFKDLTPEQATTAIHRLAMLRHYDRNLWQYVYRAMGPLSKKLTMKEMANYVWACGRVRKEADAADAYARVIATTPSATPADVSTSLWALSNLSARDHQEAKSLLAQHALMRVPHASLEGLCQIASALVSVSSFPREILPAIYHRVVGIDTIPARQITGLSRAFVELKTEFAAPLLRDLLQKFGNDFTQQGIALTCKAYAAVNMNAYDHLREQALRLKWDPQELALLLPALGSINKNIAPVRNASVKGFNHAPFVEFFTFCRRFVRPSVSTEYGIHILHAFAASRFYDVHVFDLFAKTRHTAGKEQAMALWAFATVRVPYYGPADKVSAPRDIANASWALSVLERWDDCSRLPKLDVRTLQHPAERFHASFARLALALQKGYKLREQEVDLGHCTPTVSRTHMRVSKFLTALGVKHQMEECLPGSSGLVQCDIVIPEKRVVIEIDGRAHFVYDLESGDDRLDGFTWLKHQLIRKLGWKVESVHHVTDSAESTARLKEQLQYLAG